MAFVAPAAPAGATASLQGLITQRQQLQAEYLKLVGSRRADMDLLMTAQDRLKDLRRHIADNAQVLAGIDAQVQSLQARLDAVQGQRSEDVATAGAIARGQYKSLQQDQLTSIVFSSSNLGQVVNRIVAADAVSQRAHQLASDLKREAQAITTETAALAAARSQAAQLQETLSAQSGQLQQTAAVYQARLSGLNAQTRALLDQIDAVNQQIAAAGGGPSGRVYYSRAQVIQIIHTAAARYGQNGDYMTRVASCESSLNPYAYDRASGASGLFQFMPGTFYAHGGHDIWNPADQSNVAAKMFSQGYSYEWSCA